MRTAGYISGYISVVDAFRLLEAGITVYVVSAPPETNALPLDGGWKDDDGKVHLDCSAVVLNPATARAIGEKYNQQCILQITPCFDGKSEVYLLKDSPLARQVSLDYCGGYTADGEYLFTAVDADCSPFEEAYEDLLIADIEFIPVK
jgi:hypothetical protein